MGFVCTACTREVATRGNFCPYCGNPAPQSPERQEPRLHQARPADAGDPLIGRTLANKYFVSRLLGRGGMGQVYRATDVALGREVALKVLDRSLLADATMVQRFQREGRAASRLNHPNCITILDVGEVEDGTLFIAMEYLAGRPLSRLLAEEAPLAPERAVRIAAQILAALADAHASGIIHRDLKPSNVMIEARRDEPDFVKVLDFGLAKLTEAPRLTGSGIVCGTPGYMSPEQARCEELDARSDLYAVGVILYELLSGRLPFDGGTSVGFARRAEGPIPLRERRPELELPPELAALVERALAPDRAQRPAGAGAMRQELLACRLSGAGHDRPTPRPERASTVVLQAARPEAPPPRANPAPPAAPKVVRLEFSPTGARREAAASAGASAHPTELRQPTTPLPRQRMTPAHPPEPPPARDAEPPSPRRTPAKAPPVARRGRPVSGRRGPGAGLVAAFVGAGLAVIALVVYLLAASDPFAAPPPAAGEEARLNLGGGLQAPRPVEPAGGASLRHGEERR